MGAITHNGEVLQSLPADASQINFDKTGTDLNSTQTENAIKEVNTKANTLQSEKADTDIVASDFSTAVSYTAGNYCVQDGKLYKFKNNHSGAWSSADVDEVKITGELSALKSGLTLVPVTVTAETGVTILNGAAYIYGKVLILNYRLQISTPASNDLLTFSNIGELPEQLPVGAGLLDNTSSNICARILNKIAGNALQVLVNGSFIQTGDVWVNGVIPLFN